MKRIISMAAAAALLGLTANPANALWMYRQNLIASWENQMDHFGTGTDFDDAFFVTDIGVTEGDYALALDFKAGWHQGLRSAYVDGLEADWEPFFPQLEYTSYLRLDVTSNRTLFNNPSGEGSAQFALFMQGQAGGTPAGFNTTYSYELITPAYYPESTYTTDTIEWDLTVADPLPEYTEEGGGWFDMRFHTNVTSGIADPGIVVIDNLRVPGGIVITGPGDFNCDCVVDTADYTVWADHFGEWASEAFYEYSYGFEDHIISTVDYTIWADNFGNEYVLVPEPGGCILLCLGAAAIIRRRRAA